MVMEPLTQSESEIKNTLPAFGGRGFTSQVKTKCNICGENHEIDYGISSTDPSVQYQPIEELIAAYEELE